MIYDIAVIGGGPAGCMAAITAGEQGASVVLLEANKKIGRKLLITGKGRCNITNNSSPENIIKNTVRNSRFLYSSINNFTASDLMNFFENKGVKLKTERGNRVFPVSDKSSDIVDALFFALKKTSTVRFGFSVCSVCRQNKLFEISSLNGEKISCKAVILATGGMSYSATGSKGDGYIFAESFGHKRVSTRPSLVPISCSDEDILFLQGLTLKNVRLDLWEKKKKKPIFSEQGEMLFTHFGVSGPLVLSASCHVSKPPCEYKLTVDLKPALSYTELDSRILKDFEVYKNKIFSNALSDLLPSKLISVIINRSGIPAETKVNSITKTQREALIKNLKEFSLTISSLGSMEEAVITCGGIDVKEINPNSMESKLTDGLYFAGEIIDCDAYTGGYNLQIAFSTGYAAGFHAASKIHNNITE